MTVGGQPFLHGRILEPGANWWHHGGLEVADLSREGRKIRSHEFSHSFPCPVVAFLQGDGIMVHQWFGLSLHILMICYDIKLNSIMKIDKLTTDWFGSQLVLQLTYQFGPAFGTFLLCPGQKPVISTSYVYMLINCRFTKRKSLVLPRHKIFSDMNWAWSALSSSTQAL